MDTCPERRLCSSPCRSTLQHSQIQMAHSRRVLRGWTASAAACATPRCKFLPSAPLECNIMSVPVALLSSSVLEGAYQLSRVCGPGRAVAESRERGRLRASPSAKWLITQRSERGRDGRWCSCSQEKLRRDFWQACREFQPRCPCTALFIVSCHSSLASYKHHHVR